MALALNNRSISRATLNLFLISSTFSLDRVIEIQQECSVHPTSTPDKTNSNNKKPLYFKSSFSKFIRKISLGKSSLVIGPLGSNYRKNLGCTVAVTELDVH